jgi:hypothetical protein
MASAREKTGAFSDRVGNSIRKTEYPISNTEYPTDLSACTHRQTHRQMKGRKDEPIQQSEKINFFFNKTTG